MFDWCARVLLVLTFHRTRQSRYEFQRVLGFVVSSVKVLSLRLLLFLFVRLHGKLVSLIFLQLFHHNHLHKLHKLTLLFCYICKFYLGLYSKMEWLITGCFQVYGILSTILICWGLYSKPKTHLQLQSLSLFYLSNIRIIPLV